MSSAVSGAPLGSALLRHEWASDVSAVGERLAPFGLELAEGTALDMRRPVVFRGRAAEGPVVVVHSDLGGGSADAAGTVPRPIELLAEALSRSANDATVDLRVVCAPPGWERNSHALRSVAAGTDFEIRIDIPEAIPRGDASRRLRVRIGADGLRDRIARRLEENPVLYGLATVAEFSVKHPLFGQVLCGGPCGLSGAWQFTCTMAKTFVSRREIERNLLDRPIFERMRRHSNARVQRLWRIWERMLALQLVPAILLRRAIVAEAARVPCRWFVAPRGIVPSATTRLLNHLECPKSLRNGACGAPTAENLCGELLKYGVAKPCVFVYRNARDRGGASLAMALLEWARRIEAQGRARPGADALRIAVAIVDRRRLSLRIYPAVAPELPGASAILNAMAGRFSGATMFGSPEHLPSAACRSSISVAATSAQSASALDRGRAAVRRIPRDLAHGPEILAAILGSIGVPRKPAAAPSAPERSNYERMLTAGSW